MIFHKLWKAVCLSWMLLIGQHALASGVEFEAGWQQVLTRNDALEAQQANISRARHMQDAAAAKRLPSINLTANYTRLDKPLSVDLKEMEPLKSKDIPKLLSQLPLPGFQEKLGELMKHTKTEISGREVVTSAVSAVWPVFTGGRINALQEIAGQQAEEAYSLLDLERMKKFEEYAKRYFGNVLAGKVLDARKDAETGLKQHYEHALKLEKQGQIAAVERLQAQASYDKARVDRRKAEHDLQIASAGLNSMLKTEVDADPTSPLFINRALPPLNTFVFKTLSNYPGLSLLESKKKQAEGLIDMEKGKYYPSVFLFGRYSLHEGKSLAARSAPDWVAGVGIKMSLLDSGGRSGKLHAAHSAVDQVGYLRAQADRDLRLLVRKTYSEAEQALQEYTALESSRDLARESVRLREKSFTQGLSTSLDVVDARLFLVSIQTQRLAAAYQYVVSLSRLLALSGEMNDFSKYQISAVQGVVK